MRRCTRSATDSTPRACSTSTTITRTSPISPFASSPRAATHRPRSTRASSGSPGYSNEDDNEITGIHVSNGDIDKDGILGAKEPRLFDHKGEWRAFWTQQHGDNFTWELIG